MDLVVYLLLGRLLIWAAQNFAPFRWAVRALEWGLLTELFTCDFCLGFWVYLLLKFGFPSVSFGYHEIVELVTVPILASFAMSLIVAGWRAKYGYEVLE